MRHPLLALAVVLLAAPQVWADMGPLPTMKNAATTYQIETEEAYPDFVIVVTEHRWKFNEETRIGNWTDTSTIANLTPDQPLVIVGKHRDLVVLYVIPRSLIGDGKTAEEVLDAYYANRAGVVLEQFGFRESVPAWGADEITITYRLQRKKSGEGAEIVRTSPHRLNQWYTAAVLFSLAIMFGGYWLARRIVRRGRAKPAT